MSKFISVLKVNSSVFNQSLLIQLLTSNKTSLEMVADGLETSLPMSYFKLCETLLL